MKKNERGGMKVKSGVKAGGDLSAKHQFKMQEATNAFN
jgi:hypothetical protein